MALQIDNISNLQLVSIGRSFAQNFNAVDVSGASAIGYTDGAPLPAFSLSGYVNESSASASKNKAQQLMELVGNHELKYHYIQFPSAMNENISDGWYAFSSPLQIERNPGSGSIYRFSLDVVKLGTLNDSRWALRTSAANETITYYTGLTPLTMIALPKSVTSYGQAVTETLTASDGTTQILINPTRNTVAFTESATIADMWLADCKVYDSNTAGDTTEANWSQVYGTGHKFGGDCIMQNGLMRYKIGASASTVYAYESVSSNSWKTVGTLDTLDGAGANATTTAMWQVTKITPEELRWSEARQYGANQLRIDFTLRRGARFVRLSVQTFAATLVASDALRVTKASGFAQLFSGATNNAAGSGNIAVNASYNYGCAYNTSDKIVAGFAYTSQPSYSPPDPGASGNYLGSGLTWGASTTKVLFLLAWAQDTSAFNLTTGRATALALSTRALSNVQVSQCLVPRTWYV